GFGVEIRVNSRVGRVLVENGQAIGVALDNGDEFKANTIVTTLHPRTAFLEHVGEKNLPADFARDIKTWKTRSGVVKINLALSDPRICSGDPGTERAEHNAGGVELRPARDSAERASPDARGGKPAAQPFSDGVIPTAFDKTLCPEGTHIMSLFTQWVPSDWNLEPHTSELEAYADRMIGLYDEVAPNFKASILH